MLRRQQAGEADAVVEQRMGFCVSHQMSPSTQPHGRIHARETDIAIPYWSQLVANARIHLTPREALANLRLVKTDSGRT
jgi:hypothetical protein